MIVAGFGFRASATVHSLRDALTQVAGALQPTHLAAPQDKATAPPLSAIAVQLNLPVIAVGDSIAAAIDTPTKSLIVLEKRGTGSVAEAVALAAAGEGARLLGARCISADRLATCAIAMGVPS